MSAGHVALLVVGTAFGVVGIAWIVRTAGKLRKRENAPRVLWLLVVERGAVGRLGHVAGDRPAQRVGQKRLRRLHRDEVVPPQRLEDAIALDALDRVGHPQRGHDALPALGERRQHALDHLVRQQRARRVVDEHDGRVLGHLGEREPNRLRARVAAAHGGAHLRRRDFLGDEDRRLLPVGRGRDHDLVDPVRAL